MKVFELSKEFEVTNKELIDFLKSKGFKVSSHAQLLTEEMIEVAENEFKPVAKEKEVEEEVSVAKKTVAKKAIPPQKIKSFEPDERILCRSVVPWPIVKMGVSKEDIYRWPTFNSTEYVKYRDLQAWRQQPIIRDPMIIIEDADICEQWKSDLKDSYKKYLGISYPEEFFDKDDAEFEKMLQEAPYTYQEVIKFTAMNMIRNENYPSIQKIRIIDKVLNTGISDFI